MKPLPAYETVTYRRARHMRVTENMSDTDYHSLESLSSTGAKQLLETPFKYLWGRENPRAYNPAFELGHAVHSLVLGGGGDMVVVDADSWRTKAAREERDLILADGNTPLLAHEMEQARAVADAVLQVPFMEEALSRDHHAEVSYEWEDRETGAQLRARPDLYVPGFATIDLKTTGQTASPDEWPRTIASYSYHLQAAWYLTALDHTHGETPPYVWVVVEKTPPHLVGVYQMDQQALQVGLAMMDRAVATYSMCTDLGYWPAYPHQPQLVSLPAWALKQQKEEYV